jgi:hypothetical protein
VIKAWKALTWDTRLKVFIVFAFLIRLVHITDPPIEIAHNWRQTTSLMVARNFYQLDNNILYPTLDETGEKRGVVGMEFPALPYSIYLVSTVFGYDHWYGRLINLIVVSFGLWYFFKLCRFWFDERTSFFATMALMCSALIHLARKVLPDPMAQALVIIGIWHGTAYLKNNKPHHLLLYFLFATLGALVKIPFGAYLVVLAFPFFAKEVSTARRLFFAAISALVVGIVYWWYFIWNMHLADKFGLWYNSGRSITEGFRELGEHRGDVLERFYFNAFHSYVFFGIALAGFIVALIRKEKKLIFLLVACTPVFAGYMMKSGFLFAHHGYYALVIVPVMALFVGYLLSSIPTKYAIPLLLIGVGESIANQQHDFFIKEKEFQKTTLTTIADSLSERNELVALATNQNPNEFYFLNRKGWMVSGENIRTDFLDSLHVKGCELLFMRKGKYNEELPYIRVFENQDYLVFDLGEKLVKQ